MTKFEEFEQVIARLRAPGGCPWDRAQTHASLKRTCIEEASEVICGINIRWSCTPGSQRKKVCSPWTM